MTIVVTVRVTDGIVLAGDSATSFIDSQGNVIKVYNYANKIFNLVKGKPIGAMTYGSGNIGKASISTLSKDFRCLLNKSDSSYALEEDYTIQGVAAKAQRFFEESFKLAYPEGQQNYLTGYRVCGYSATGTLPEAWEIKIAGETNEPPKALYADEQFGPRWAGQTEAIDRLVIGISDKAMGAMIDGGMTEEQAQEVYVQLAQKTATNLYLPAMPIQDAVDLARFLAEAAAKFAQFSIQAPTVGGPIEVATITKHEGFKWVSRKHYYSTEFNRRETDHVR